MLRLTASHLCFDLSRAILEDFLAYQHIDYLCIFLARARLFGLVAAELAAFI